MELKSISEMFSDYQENVIPTAAGAVQIQECRRVFYAAIWGFINMLEELGEDHRSEDEGVAYLEARKAECRKFRDDVAAGRA